ncbi:MAG: hypothetical protein GF308_16635 [Candidatus Heimdallarchaeota archaeon]|nr:hypothetical protein [Candidatus Heimdallarchaeota archaeon]
MDKAKKTNKRRIKKARQLPQLLLLLILMMNSAFMPQMEIRGEFEVSVPITERTTSLVYKGRFLEGCYGEDLIHGLPDIAIVRRTGGISFLNISEPTKPRFVEGVQGILRKTNVVDYHNDLLFIDEEYPIGPEFHTFVIYNISDLMKPKKVGGIRLQGSKGFVIDQERAIVYYASYRDLYILNISNPANIKIITSIDRNEDYYTRGCFLVKNQYLLFWDKNTDTGKNIRLFNVSDPAEPKEMTLETPEECWFPYAWYQLEEEGDEYLFKGGNGIWILNLSNINHWETIWHQHDENIEGSTRFQEKEELFVLRYSTGTASYTLLFDSNKQAYVGQLDENLGRIFSVKDCIYSFEKYPFGEEGWEYYLEIYQLQTNERTETNLEWYHYLLIFGMPITVGIIIAVVINSKKKKKG